VQNTKLTAFLAAFTMIAAFPAQAYIGPGAGAGTIAVVLGIIAAVVMAFFAILWYPVKRLLKKYKTKQNEGTKSQTEAPKDQENP